MRATVSYINLLSRVSPVKEKETGWINKLRGRKKKRGDTEGRKWETGTKKEQDKQMSKFTYHQLYSCGTVPNKAAF